MRWLLLPVLLAACSSQEGAGDPSETAPQPVVAEPAGPGSDLAVAADSVLYIDVRTPEEFRSGHVKGALLIPYDQMEQRWRELDGYRDRPVVLYCRSGRRAGIALDILKQHGFTNVTNGGGMPEMTARGLEITTSE